MKFHVMDSTWLVEDGKVVADLTVQSKKIKEALFSQLTENYTNTALTCSLIFSSLFAG